MTDFEITSESNSAYRELTKKPHMATSVGDEETVDLMLKRWQDAETGLDHAFREDYMVYLSFPDPNNPNKVTVGESTWPRLQLGVTVKTWV